MGGGIVYFPKPEGSHRYYRLDHAPYEYYDTLTKRKTNVETESTVPLRSQLAIPSGSSIMLVG